MCGRDEISRGREGQERERKRYNEMCREIVRKKNRGLRKIKPERVRKRERHKFWGKKGLNVDKSVKGMEIWEKS